MKKFVTHDNVLQKLNGRIASEAFLYNVVKHLGKLGLLNLTFFIKERFARGRTSTDSFAQTSCFTTIYNHLDTLDVHFLCEDQVTHTSARANI